MYCIIQIILTFLFYCHKVHILACKQWNLKLPKTMSILNGLLINGGHLRQIL